MEFSINSKKIGKKVTFSKPGSYYIYVDLNGSPGSLGKQICEHGELLGGTIGSDSADHDLFEAICRRWYKAYLRKYGNNNEKEGE